MIRGEGFLPPIRDIPRVGLPFLLSGYREDAIEYLFREMLDGRLPKDICHDKDMPPYRMVRTWLASNQAFREQFIEVAKAAVLPEVLEAIHIADGTDTQNRAEQERIAQRNALDEDTSPEIAVANLLPRPVDLAHAKLRIETRLKFGERLLPEVFGKPSSRGTKDPPPAHDPLDDLLKAAQDKGSGHGLPKPVDAEVVEG